MTQPDQDDVPGADALADYRRLGPVRARLLSLAKALGLVAGWVVASLLFSTVAALNHGTGSRDASDGEPAVARVRQCLRLGPVSEYGFGFYDECRVTVTSADGRITDAVVGRSIVTPEDIGRPVDLREICSSDGDCRYGRPTAFIWNALTAVLNLLRTATSVVFVVGILMYLTGAILGTPRYLAMVQRLSRRKKVR
jgi:hypothetical protein